MDQSAGHTGGGAAGDNPVLHSVIEDEVLVWTDALEAGADAAAKTETFLHTGGEVGELFKV